MQLVGEVWRSQHGWPGGGGRQGKEQTKKEKLELEETECKTGFATFGDVAGFWVLGIHLFLKIIQTVVFSRLG